MRFQYPPPFGGNLMESVFMLEAFKINKKENISVTDSVILTYEERKKSRHRTHTSSGVELGWFLERGHVLEHGEILECNNGELIEIVAADESVSEVISDNTLALTRAAYHLGNRHVPLQVGNGFLRYLHDHVLDDMVTGLGLTVTFAKKPFHPENGAYSHASSSHEHSHTHSHEH